jgi:hypothetical protein
MVTYSPSPLADTALRTLAQLAFNMPDGETPAACEPLIEKLGGESVVQELLKNEMVRELYNQDQTDGPRVGMTNTGVEWLKAQITSGEYKIVRNQEW